MSFFDNVYNEKTVSVVNGIETLKTETQDIDKKIEDLRYILDNTFASLNQRIKAEEESSKIFNRSVDSLLLLITFLQKNIIILQETQFVTNAKIAVLENTPFYKKITVKQRHDLLTAAERKAKEKYAPIKEKELKNITEIVEDIHKRREENNND